jgi:hypothetical protein
MLVKNRRFRKIFDTHFKTEATVIKPKNIQSFTEEQVKNFLCSYPYVGMGNPDSNLLIVGSEKAYNTNLSSVIDLHERRLNFLHWKNIIEHYNHLSDNLHPILMTREDLEGFNPFSPLTLANTAKVVIESPNHTYRNIYSIINSQLQNYSSNEPVPILWEISPFAYNKSMFKHCFLTDISDLPKKRQGDGNKFRFKDFKEGCRYEHIKNGSLGDFYRNFCSILIYAGNEYAGLHGSSQRKDILQLFNPNIDVEKDYKKGYCSDIYESLKGGARIVVCHQLTSRTFNDSNNLKHNLSVLDLGNTLQYI